MKAFAPVPNDQITHNRVVRLAVDLTPASFVCLVTYNPESSLVAVESVSGTRSALFRQVLASAHRTDLDWKPLTTVPVDANAQLRSVFKNFSTVSACVGSISDGVFSETLQNSTFARFSNHWCLATPIVAKLQVYCALLFIGQRQFTRTETEKCLAFADQCQRSISNMIEERDITAVIEELIERRRRSQLDDPLGLTQRRNGMVRTPRSFGDIRLSLETQTAVRGGRDLGLTRREFDLLDTFLQSPGIALSRIQIVSRVWAERTGISSNVLSVTIKNLREKLEAEKESRVIHAIRGFGCVLKVS
ncbi:MAG: winged helix-turn-helix domain-containing protein [Chloroflexi bacterium]|nr:winged helix-turn-helix domain-containing protein [Chloroflexota bacterium]